MWLPQVQPCKEKEVACRQPPLESWDIAVKSQGTENNMNLHSQASAFWTLEKYCPDIQDLVFILPLLTSYFSLPVDFHFSPQACKKSVKYSVCQFADIPNAPASSNTFHTFHLFQVNNTKILGWQKHMEKESWMC